MTHYTGNTENLKLFLIEVNTMPVAQLQAIYNNAWREDYNGTARASAARYMMEGIEIVCGLKNISITGRGGSWEFTQMGGK